MKSLTLTLKHRTDQRVDMSPLVCQNLLGLSPMEIGGLTLQNGKRQIRVDELFQVTGEDTSHILIKNSFAKLDFIGKELKDGAITVEGDAGAYFGMGMQSGTIAVTGNVGIYAACEMKNGYMEIEGDAGDFLAGALPGNKQGMKGGIVLVKGNVAERAGDHMRRGTILIEGDVGDYCGSRMTAGTIAVMGNTGKNLGYAMRRGTLLLYKQPVIPATFNDCGSHTLAFLNVLFTSFGKLNSKFAEPEASFSRVQRYAGDLSELGRGELLVTL